MARKPPVPPSGLRRPDAELARIRREVSRGRGGRRALWTLLAFVVVPGLLFGGFAFWRFVRVTQSRKSFTNAYSDAEHDVMRAYARASLARVEQSKEEAEGANWLLEGREVCALYEDATKALREAQETAEEAKGRHERLMQRFTELYEEAQANEFHKHAKEDWGRVEELRTGVDAENNSGFSPDAARDRLKDAIELLEESRKSYAAIREYAQARSRYLEAESERDDEEWSQVAPDAIATTKRSVRRAEADAADSKWKDASRAYREAMRAFADARVRVEQARDIAKKAVSAFTLSLAQTDTRKLERNAAAAWGGIQEQESSIGQAMAEHRYADVVKLAEEAGKRLAQTREKVAEAKGRRDEILASLRKAFGQAGEHSKAFARNWRKEWLAIEAAYRSVEALAKGEDYVSLLEQAESLSQRIDKLVAERESLLGSLSKTQQECERLLAGVDVGLLSANVPQDWARAETLRSNALRDGQRGNRQEAVESYNACTELVKGALVRLAALQTKARSLRGTYSAAYRQYRRGIGAFGGETDATVRELLEGGESSWQQRNYRRAVEAFSEAGQLLPPARFVKQAGGTVIDYSAALMWTADGNGAGCNGGEKSDWYAALVWVRGLRFAGHNDWRLPTDEELLTLVGLGSAVRQDAFPNTAEGAYWTRSHLPEDVARAFCVDFGTGKSALRNKKDQLHLRAVRGPQ